MDKRANSITVLSEKSVANIGVSGSPSRVAITPNQTAVSGYLPMQISGAVAEIKAVQIWFVHETAVKITEREAVQRAAKGA